MNRLANSTSPYLLQHASNPVDWYQWGPEALQKAREENKLIIVSIGYSACHWCHVMEQESFEDEQVAAVMNEYFVCIKVDREERPDVDQIYMSAAQLMTGRGGWPLNCICLPDQRPIYGGTYFKKNDWVSLLFNLNDFYKQKPADAEDYAVRLTEGIQKYESVAFAGEIKEYTQDDIRKVVENFERYLDDKEGGVGNAPKFPMPNSWQFLLRCGHLAGDETLQRLTRLTLNKMAYGGIYDHIGGGFARYAVDGIWHVPHFEKMLYDNAQLVSLYSEAFTWNAEPLYKNAVDETVAFIKRELTSPEGGFYSALDADSEGVEGKFYTFTKTEIEDILGEDAELFCIYYNVTTSGNWHEERTNVFFRKEDDQILADKLGLTIGDLRQQIATAKQKVFDARSQRIRPGLDHKIIASWNGLMLKGLCDAYRSFNEPQFLELALNSANFIINNLLKGDRLTRIYSKNDQKPIAFLDDYANIIDAFIALYEVTFEEDWLNKAVALTESAIEHFYDEAGGIFFYTANDDEQLIARKSEIMDGVIPSSNSVMARNLKKLALLFENDRYAGISAQLLRNIMPHLLKYPSAYANWGILLMEEVYGVYEVVITGTNHQHFRIEMEKNYIPNKIMLGGNVGTLPLLHNRIADTTRIFVCKDKSCGLPAHTVAEALKQISLPF
jgi:uncharacterized protein YyaL (SSP411 family)